MLRNRFSEKGKAIQYIEVVDGKVVSKNGNGKDSLGYYISYKGIDCHKGDRIRTYLAYNPFTNYTDDVIERWDYVINCPHQGR